MAPFPLNFEQDLTWFGSWKPKNEESMFKVGDRVFDYLYGWGEVETITQEKVEYPLVVKFDYLDDCERYTLNGSLFNDSNPTLSFKEYTLNGFSQERPWEPEIPKIGEWAFFWDNQNVSHCHWAVLKSVNKNYIQQYESKGGFQWDNCSKTPPPHLGGK